MQRDFLGQHTVDVATERVPDLTSIRSTFEPMGEEGRRHPVAWLDPANHRTDRDDISRAIGTGSDWAIYPCRIYPLGDHQIAIV
jgi:hypothetical protein